MYVTFKGTIDNIGFSSEIFRLSVVGRLSVHFSHMGPCELNCNRDHLPLKADIIHHSLNSATMVLVLALGVEI
jgi:hypothetical protein